MGKFYILTQILQGNALFTGKIYTARKFFTRPPVATVVTNFKSDQDQCNVEQSLNLQFSSQICFVFLLLGARKMKRWAGVELIQTCVEETIVQKSSWQKTRLKTHCFDCADQMYGVALDFFEGMLDCATRSLPNMIQGWVRCFCTP